MTSKIDFESFKNGDKVIITISGKNAEEVYPGKIIDISLTKKLIKFEDNESEYECKFSEVKSIVYTEKPFPYGVLIILLFVLTIPFAFRATSTILLILISLDIWQYFRIKNDKLHVYEKQNNTPYTLSIPTCICICPMIMHLIILGFITKLFSGYNAFIFILLACFLSWLPGLIWFITDQIRLYQYNKNHQENASFVVRMVVFLVFYPFFTFFSYGMLLFFTSGYGMLYLR
jgi:hypothetical protein